MERADLLLKVVSGKIILLLEYMRMTQTATDEKPAPSRRFALPLQLLELSFALRENGVRPERGC